MNPQIRGFNILNLGTVQERLPEVGYTDWLDNIVRLFGVSVIVGYSEVSEKTLVTPYESLSEKDRRCYDAIEAEKHYHGGTDDIATVFGCDQETICRGTREVGNPPNIWRPIRPEKGSRSSRLSAKRSDILQQALAFESKSSSKSIIAG